MNEEIEFTIMRLESYEQIASSMRNMVTAIFIPEKNDILPEPTLILVSRLQ